MRRYLSHQRPHQRLRRDPLRGGGGCVTGGCGVHNRPIHLPFHYENFVILAANRIMLSLSKAENLYERLAEKKIVAAAVWSNETEASLLLNTYNHNSLSRSTQVVAAAPQRETRPSSLSLLRREKSAGRTQESKEGKEPRFVEAWQGSSRVFSANDSG